MEDLLPAELTIDILSRLPVKTIVHCKCVCKKWRNLVMDASFVDLHLSRSPKGLIIHHKPVSDSNFSNDRNDPGILGWVEVEDKDDYHHLHHDPLMSLALNLAPILQKSEIDYKGSVNGLICLWQKYPNIDNTYICNPITREYMILPRQKYHRKGYETVIYGFGVSSVTGEYKVIRTFQGEIPLNGDKSYQPIHEAEVYTLGTGQWKSLGRVPYQLCQTYGSNCPFMNNRCHWIVSNKEDVPEKLCTFDLDKETFQLFPSPPPPLEEEEAIQGSLYHFECLAILNGCLCKTDTYETLSMIWVMKEYGIKKSWHKEVVIKRAVSPDLRWRFWGPMHLIEDLKDGSILMVCAHKLLAFDPKSATYEEKELFEFSMTMNAMAYHPGFLKLQNFELERVHMF